jgi:hypothetical protein
LIVSVGLALFRCVAAVEALVHKAEAEASHAGTLGALEARWAAVRFATPDGDDLATTNPNARAASAETAAGKNGSGKKASRAARAKAARAAAAVAHLLLPLAFADPLDLERLKNDQVVLMYVCKSEFGRFHAAAGLWRERLDAVEALLALAKDNRDAAAFLHPLYTKSKEVSEKEKGFGIARTSFLFCALVSRFHSAYLSRLGLF